MPFLTEEIWSLIKDQKESSIIISNWPNIGSIDSNYIENFQHTQKIITNIRKFRNVNGISVNKRIELLSKNKPDYNFEFKEIVLRLVNVTMKKLIIILAQLWLRARSISYQIILN